ncbi:MAG: hypothetical protein AAGB13_09055 [Cyanobacteria bacterium P01_F01_bin.33]
MAATRTLVMEAVDRLNWQVTIGDVAGQTGLALDNARQELMSLARDAGGQMHVSDRGDILYTFERNYRAILNRRANASRYAVLRRKLWQGFLSGLRLSFGVILVLSILVAIGIIIALQIAAQSSQSGDRNRSGSFGSRRGGGIFIPNLWIGNPFWHYSTRSRYRRGRFAPGSLNRNQFDRARSTSSGNESELNFLEAVYSFIFGDGNPNADLEERSDRAIANTIRAQGGVITGEQVLPLLPEAPAKDQMEYEDYMLPVLVQFDGQPQVSDRGEIVYQFPELQAVADSVKQSTQLPAQLKEQPWSFSQASSGQLMLAGGLGLVNLVLWSGLQAAVIDVAALSGLSGGFVGFVFGIFFTYGLLFLGIPLVRWFALQRRNQKVEARNRQRLTWADNSKSPAVASKLAFAREFVEQHVVSDDSTIYSTIPDIEGAIDHGDLDSLESGAIS